MKFILLIAFLFAITIASGELIEVKKNLARSVAPEELALELQFYGTCQEFKDRVLPSIWISKHDLCLPIQFNVTENPDVDDLRTHYFCTNIDDNKSIIHFVEIYESDETVQFPSFVVSLVPSAPFRVLTQRTLVSRRPNCFITNDYCVATNAVVNSCRSNPVVYKKGYIISHDRIYITANQQESRDCRTSVTECCAYIAPLTFGGICEHVASTDVLKFPKKHHDHDDHKDGKKPKPGNGHQGNGHQGNNWNGHGKQEQPNTQSGKEVVNEVVQQVVQQVQVQPQIQQEVQQQATQVKEVPTKSEEEDDGEENDNENQ